MIFLEYSKNKVYNFHELLHLVFMYLLLSDTSHRSAFCAFECAFNKKKKTKKKTWNIANLTVIMLPE